MKKPVIRIRQNHHGFFIVEQKPGWFSGFINYLLGHAIAEIGLVSNHLAVMMPLKKRWLMQSELEI